MNERIKEFAKVAVQLTDDTVAHLERVHNRYFTSGEIDEIYDAKFAELIVRECATLAYDGPNGILEHFGLGVEE